MVICANRFDGSNQTLNIASQDHLLAFILAVGFAYSSSSTDLPRMVAKKITVYREVFMEGKEQCKALQDLAHKTSVDDLVARARHHRKLSWTVQLWPARLTVIHLHPLTMCQEARIRKEWHRISRV